MISSVIILHFLGNIKRILQNFEGDCTKMKTTAVICEYNPLHFGHEYAVKCAKTNDDDRVVAIMSSNFVQRGEAAIAPAHIRARAAIAAGCDLVLELPAPYSFGSAEYFARAGVYIADAVGVCDSLIFGSETGDIEKLRDALKKLEGDKMKQMLLKIHSRDRSLGTVATKSAAASELYGEDFSRMITQPNNVLAIEYIKAADMLKSTLKLETIVRKGCGYNDENCDDGFVSAAFLRKRILQNEDISAYVPDECMKIYREARERKLLGAKLENAESAILWALRSAEELPANAEAASDLWSRLCKAANEATTLECFFELAATKRYTNARIRRTVLSYMLGVTKNDFKTMPTYTRVLAANEKGVELLKQMKKRSKIPALTTVSALKKSGEHERQYLIARRADALYSLMLPSNYPSGKLFKLSAEIDKK